ncbi:hypothetical protein [Pedobacter sp. ASV28]|uniref:hypothetical protein n=1 Tax=Pedobacter sp. ASV28 TaxID=2795123 RepID=UPI0018EDF72C|nr:hypothetical protein [Pedobacter sp. ASV28]
MISKGWLHQTYDKETENFIDAAGLNNDANLNVDGLYIAFQARQAIQHLVAGLKAIKDVGQITSAWDANVCLFPCIGGTISTVESCLKNPSNKLTNVSGVTAFSATTKGIIGAATNNISFSSGYIEGSTFSSYLYYGFDNSIKTVVGWGNIDNTLHKWYTTSDNWRFGTSTNSTQAPFKGALNTIHSSGRTVLNQEYSVGVGGLLQPFPSNTVPTQLYFSYYFNGFHFNTNTEQNCMGLFNRILTISERRKLNNLLEFVNAYLGRSTIR